MVEGKQKTASPKKKSIKRSISMDVVKKLDKDLKQKLLEDYTDILYEQETRKRNQSIDEARRIFNVKKNLVKGLGNNPTEREEKLALVSSFPLDEPTTDKGWSRVLGIMERKGKKKTKKVVEFPATKPKSKVNPKKVKTKSKSKTTTKK